MRTTTGVIVIVWAALGSLFWLIDELLINVLPETLRSIGIRNIVLAAVFVAIVLWEWFRGQTTVGSVARFVSFEISLWLTGAVVDVVHQLAEGVTTAVGALISIIVFPLTVLGTATMSGILPAFMVASGMAIILIRPRSKQARG